MLRWEYMGVPPRRAAIELKLAHIKLETGLRHCHCWNLGNLKWKQGQCWTFFSCGEEIEESALEKVQSLSPGKVTVKGRYMRGGKAWLSLWIEAKHPWTRFAAFETLLDGVDAQLDYLRKPSHQDVLAALQTGDAKAYVQALYHDGYFTADPNLYLAGSPTNDRDGLIGCLNDVVRECRGFDWGDVS